MLPPQLGLAVAHPHSGTVALRPLLLVTGAEPALAIRSGEIPRNSAAAPQAARQSSKPAE